MKRREDLSWFEQLYLPGVIRGLAVTFGHLLRNFFVFLLQQIGLLKDLTPWATVEYPDAVRPYAPRYRGQHRLTLNPDGTVRCTACFLCATACPSRCIYIEAAEHADPRIQKYPARYEIDTLLCIYCGYCVEACPVDAIRMDTGIHPEVYPSHREAFVEDKETLMERSRILEREGPERMMQEHLAAMRDIERYPRRAR